MTTRDEGEQWLLEGLASGPESGMTAAEALETLGGNTDAQPTGARARDARSRRDRLAAAKKALGFNTDSERQMDEQKRQWVATEWRYRILSQLRLHKERERFVSLVEEFMDGTETSVPGWLSQSVGRIVEYDNRQPPEAPPNIPWPELYRRLAEAYHREAKS